jgi:DNA (cytosine-5)-methyltransferase 1
MTESFAVIDLFAGPGGLAEGFSRVRRGDGSKAFRVVLSVEMEKSAHRTLRLRAFLRQFGDAFPQEYYDWIRDGCGERDWGSTFPEQWEAACLEAVNLKLGDPEADALIAPRLDEIKNMYGGATVVIGGPPCQAYSLVGRARNAGIGGYVFEEDHRHELYKSYVNVLARLQPAAFVLENVKGMLSTKANGLSLFQQILMDLRAAGGQEESYELFALTPDTFQTERPAPSDFVVRAERHGIPQARHRVIIIGLRRDIAKRRPEITLTGALPQHSANATVKHVIGCMPRIRSGLSRERDSTEEWNAAVLLALNSLKQVCNLSNSVESTRLENIRAVTESAILAKNVELPRAASDPVGCAPDCPELLRNWLHDLRLERVLNHETRGHIRSDLTRYLFASVYATAFGRSPTAEEFPAILAPAHANWMSGKFADRFKVQLWDMPASTITSHISKDGHYFIHPDPTQCRSLTVREAARLQTFPDNYAFLGNRTQQYVQVGNAVPPLLAWQIGHALLSTLDGKQTRSGMELP